MYQVEQGEPSQDFKSAWQEAGRFIQSKGAEGINWIRATLNPPMAEHLSFRIGNQLFFIFVEAAEFNFENGKKLFLDVSHEANAIPCIMTMNKRLTTYEPMNSGWGLIHAESGHSVDPGLMVSDELIEMSDWEIHDFAIQMVKEHLSKQGKKVFSAQSSLKIDPSIWFEDSKKACWVVVRAVKYPEKEAIIPPNINEISQGCSRMGDTGYFASVVVVNSNDPFDPDAQDNGNYLPIYRGHGINVKFSGLKNVS